MISFEINSKACKKKGISDIVSLDKTKFRLLMREVTGIMNTQQLVNKIRMQKKKAAEKSNRRAKRTPYWWNTEIEELRTEAIIARRKVTRAHRKRQNAQVLEEDLKVKKKKLKSAINTSKRELWENLCREIDEDIWGSGYKIVAKR